MSGHCSSHSQPPRVYLPPGCCPVDPLGAVPLCDLMHLVPLQ